MPKFLFPRIHGPDQDLCIRSITLWFPCLDRLIQTRGKVARVKKSAKNHLPSARISRAFFNSRNFPACLDQAIQTRKPQINCIFAYFKILIRVLTNDTGKYISVSATFFIHSIIITKLIFASHKGGHKYLQV